VGLPKFSCYIIIKRGQTRGSAPTSRFIKHLDAVKKMGTRCQNESLKLC